MCRNQPDISKVIGQIANDRAAVQRRAPELWHGDENNGSYENDFLCGGLRFPFDGGMDTYVIWQERGPGYATLAS